KGQLPPPEPATRSTSRFSSIGPLESSPGSGKRLPSQLRAEGVIAPSCPSRVRVQVPECSRAFEEVRLEMRGNAKL
ncbi:MAG: hypothetical protein ACK52S_06505, partial [Pirellula sp.]